MPARPVPISAGGGGVNIEAWTAETIQSISTLQISAATVPEPIRRTNVTLDISLDDEVASRAEERARAEAAGLARRASYKRREPLRRDSLKHRQALLKGKEGSRRRQKWENGEPFRHSNATRRRLVSKLIQIRQTVYWATPGLSHQSPWIGRSVPRIPCKQCHTFWRRSGMSDKPRLGDVSQVRQRPSPRTRSPEYQRNYARS